MTVLGMTLLVMLLVGKETIETTTKVHCLAPQNERYVSTTHVPITTPHPNTHTKMGGGGGGGSL